MRTTLNIDEEVYKKAAEMTGVREKTALVHLGFGQSSCKKWLTKFFYGIYLLT